MKSFYKLIVLILFLTSISTSIISTLNTNKKLNIRNYYNNNYKNKTNNSLIIDDDYRFDSYFYFSL